MRPLVLMMVLAAAPAGVAREHGLTVTAPPGWTTTMDGSTFVFNAPKANAELRVALFEKEKRGDPKDCLDQIVSKLAAADGVKKETFTPTTVDAQPAALQTSVDNKRQKVRRIVGCNGKSYFLIDWLDVGASARHEEAFATMLAQIKYEAAAEPKPKPKPAVKKEEGGGPVEPLVPLDPATGAGQGTK